MLGSEVSLQCVFYKDQNHLSFQERNYAKENNMRPKQKKEGRDKRR